MWHERVVLALDLDSHPFEVIYLLGSFESVFRVIAPPFKWSARIFFARLQRRDYEPSSLASARFVRRSPLSKSVSNESRTVNRGSQHYTDAMFCR